MNKVNLTWLSVVVAAVFEVGWVIGLKHSTSVLEWLGTAIAIFVSFFLMIRASQVIPVGTVYAVFVGLGTAGTVLVEVLLFGADIELKKIALIALLLLGVIGLKLLSNDKKEEVRGR